MKNYHFAPHREAMHLHLSQLQGMPHYNEIQGEVEKYIEQGMTEFALDLSELQYIDSVGLSLLITILTKARNAGGDVSLVGSSAKVEKMLMVTKLQNLFKKG
jgi:anti-anti-sigma factor